MLSLRVNGSYRDKDPASFHQPITQIEIRARDPLSRS